MAFTGVLFDCFRTLVMAGSFQGWLGRAVEASGDGPFMQEEDVVEVLRTVWARAADRYPDARWDLDPHLHREFFQEILTSEAGCTRRLAGVLYDTMPDQWRPAPGAVELLQSLKAGGYRAGLLSNTGIDLRPRLAELGLLDALDTVVLSFEEGMVKPDPRIFGLAADRLWVPAGACVFVGDTPKADGGAVHAGMTSILIPVRGGVPQMNIAADLLVGS